MKMHRLFRDTLRISARDMQRTQWDDVVRKLEVRLIAKREGEGGGGEERGVVVWLEKGGGRGLNRKTCELWHSQ